MSKKNPDGPRCKVCRIRRIALRAEYPQYNAWRVCEKCGCDRVIEEDRRAEEKARKGQP